VLEVRIKKSKYNEDNPLFDTATQGPFQAQFWHAMRIEFKTLTEESSCWEYDPNPGKNIPPSTWAFKIKRYPDGRVKKLRPGFLQEVIGNKKELITSKPGLQSFNGQRYE